MERPEACSRTIADQTSQLLVTYLRAGVSRRLHVGSGGQEYVAESLRMRDTMAQAVKSIEWVW